MHDQPTRKRNQTWSVQQIVTVIGISLLLVATSFAAYLEIDDQARIESESTHSQSTHQ